MISYGGINHPCPPKNGATSDGHRRKLKVRILHNITMNSLNLYRWLFVL